MDNSIGLAETSLKYAQPAADAYLQLNQEYLRSFTSYKRWDSSVREISPGTADAVKLVAESPSNYYTIGDYTARNPLEAAPMLYDMQQDTVISQGATLFNAGENAGRGIYDIGAFAYNYTPAVQALSFAGVDASASYVGQRHWAGNYGVGEQYYPSQFSTGLVQFGAESLAGEAAFGLVLRGGRYAKSAAGVVDDATRGLATNADEAVFWSGIRKGDSTAAKWVSHNGGATLETTLKSRGIKLPVWDANNPATVAAWRRASKEFASGASGKVRVLQNDTVRLKSVWAEVEFPALKANTNVNSIWGVHPETGAETLLWAR